MDYGLKTELGDQERRSRFYRGRFWLNQKISSIARKGYMQV